VTKIIMGICFILLFILGMSLAIAASVALADSKVFSNISITGFKEVIYFALCLGLFVAIVSVFGIIGYFMLNKHMLIVFSCLLAILVILQVACGATAFSYRDDFYNITESAWHHAENSTREYFQKTFECCGGANITDYAIETENCTATEVNIDDLLYSSKPFDHGCVEPMANAMKDNVVSVGIGDIVITILELVVIIVTIVVVVKIHRAGSYRRFHDDDEATLASLR